MSRRTAGRDLDNAGKDNVVDAGLVEAVLGPVRMPGEVCDHATMLLKNFEHLVAIPDATDGVG